MDACAGEGAVEGSDAGGTASSVQRLLDGVNYTVDESHMWLVPVSRHPENCLGEQPIITVGIRVGRCRHGCVDLRVRIFCRAFVQP